MSNKRRARSPALLALILSRAPPRKSRASSPVDRWSQDLRKTPGSAARWITTRGVHDRDFDARAALAHLAQDIVDSEAVVLDFRRCCPYLFTHHYYTAMFCLESIRDH